jgi:S1-C subfamily serine protease
MHKPSFFLPLLFLFCFFPILAFAQAGGSLAKKTSSEKFVEALKVRYAGSHWDIRVFEIDNESPTEQELKAIAPFKGKDLEKKQYLIYPGLKSLDEKENRLYNALQGDLKRSGYVDTLNRLFIDRINLVLLDVRIDSMDLYLIGRKKGAQSVRTRLYVTWFLNNYFEEITDTLSTDNFSGTYDTEEAGAIGYLQDSPEDARVIVLDAFKNNLTRLYDDKTFRSRLKAIDNYVIDAPLLTLMYPDTAAYDRETAGEGCVIVKTESRHGSGFAVTHDGYIITSYSAVDEAIANKKSLVKVITANGEELEAVILRNNRYRNVALLKVEKRFARAFRLPMQKNYKYLGSVYTIGTPNSIELGQSMSPGIISTERNTNNNHYIQLNMSLNYGNNGGPLFNDSGQLCGMVVAKLTGYSTEGVAFAIPAFLLENYLRIQFKR